MPATTNFGGGVGTNHMATLKQKLDELIGKTPASLGATSPVRGSTPPGITIQAEGPSVTFKQAPPNVSVVANVNVTKPDETPSATATAVAGALGRQQAFSIWDTGYEV